MKTLNSFIDEKISAPKREILPRATQPIEPKKYIVAIQPKLDESTQPFTYTGAVYVTFVTNVDYVHSLQLQCNGVEPMGVLNVQIFQMLERNYGPVKRSINESNSFDDNATTEESTTQTVESTTAAITEKNTEVLTTTSTSTTSTATTPTHAPKEITARFTSALDVFSNYFLKYEDRSSELPIRDKVFDRFNETITVSTRLSLRKDTLYVVKIEFESNMTDIGYGFLLSSYLDETQTRRYGNSFDCKGNLLKLNSIHRYFASTNTNARMTRPIFPTILHDRNQRTVFDIVVLHRPQLIALTNSKLTEQYSNHINGSEWKLSTFQTTAPMRISDVSIVITQIGPTLITSASPTVSAYIRVKKSPNFAIDDGTLAKVITAFENITGIKHYMDRINLVGVPNNRQRSIAPGMIVASENDFVKATRSDDQLQRIANIVLLFANLWYLPIAQYENDYDSWLNDAMPLYLQWHAFYSVGEN